MLKVRLMGKKNSIRQFGRILRKIPGIEVLEFSDLYPNKGTEKYYRAYVEIEIKETNRKREQRRRDHVQNNRSRKSKRRGGKDHHDKQSWDRACKAGEKGAAR